VSKGQKHVMTTLDLATINKESAFDMSEQNSLSADLVIINTYFSCFGKFLSMRNALLTNDREMFRCNILLIACLVNTIFMALVFIYKRKSIMN
jgi:hypothetical protein